MKKYLKLATIIIVLVITGITIHINRVRIYTQLKAWKLVPLPEPLTELYFNDHINLPKVYAKDTKYPFSFTIHNIEYQDFEYHYRVTAISDNFQSNPNVTITNSELKIATSENSLKIENSGSNPELSELITEGVVQLAHDSFATLSATFSSTLAYSRVRVQVDLVGRDQSIHFWLDAPVTPTPINPAKPEGRSGTPAPGLPPDF